MRIPFHQPSRNVQRHRQAIEAAVAKTLDDGFYILGPKVENFERAFARYCDAAYCIGLASGTDALLLGLLALKVQAGDEVIAVANAGGYTSSVCFRLGATPVYVDVNPDTLLADFDHIESAITPKTRVLVITHLFGNMVDMAAMRKLADHHHIGLLEDCAQAHGALWQGRRAGSWGDIGSFSFYPTKNLGALGDGGAIICQDSDIANKVRELRQYGWRDKYSVQRPYGINSRLDALQAAVLEAKLPYLDDDNQRRREIAEHYRNALTGTQAFLITQTDPSGVAHLGVIRHPRRDQIKAELQKAGVGTDIHYPILDCDQPGWQKLSWNNSTLPLSRRACEEIISLPLYPELSESEVSRVCEILHNTVIALA